MNKSFKVKYFKVIYKGMEESHYTKNTADFYDWLRLFTKFDPNVRVTYIEFDNDFSLLL